MMRAWIAGAVLALCGVARADDVLTRVEAWLGAGIEPLVVHEQLLALGEAGEAALWTLYGDASRGRVVRLRALSQLGAFATPRTAQGLAMLLRQAPSAPDAFRRSPLVLRRALDGLSALAETLSTGITASELAFVLEHPDAHVRKAAATLLARLDRGDVEGALHAMAERDPSRMVRATAQRARASRAR